MRQVDERTPQFRIPTRAYVPLLVVRECTDHPRAHSDDQCGDVKQFDMAARDLRRYILGRDVRYRVGKYSQDLGRRFGRSQTSIESVVGCRDQ